MGSAAGIMQHIAEKHLHDTSKIYVVHRMVNEMVRDDSDLSQMDAAAALHHAVHVSAQVRGLDAHDPADADALQQELTGQRDS